LKSKLLVVHKADVVQAWRLRSWKHQFISYTTIVRPISCPTRTWRILHAHGPCVHKWRRTPRDGDTTWVPFLWC